MVKAKNILLLRVIIIGALFSNGGPAMDEKGKEEAEPHAVLYQHEVQEPSLNTYFDQFFSHIMKEQEAANARLRLYLSEQITFDWSKVSIFQVFDLFIRAYDLSQNEPLAQLGKLPFLNFIPEERFAQIIDGCGGYIKGLAGAPSQFIPDRMIQNKDSILCLLRLSFWAYELLQNGTLLQLGQFGKQALLYVMTEEQIAQAIGGYADYLTAPWQAVSIEAPQNRKVGDGDIAIAKREDAPEPSAHSWGQENGASSQPDAFEALNEPITDVLKVLFYAYALSYGGPLAYLGKLTFLNVTEEELLRIVGKYIDYGQYLDYMKGLIRALYQRVPVEGQLEGNLEGQLEDQLEGLPVPKLDAQLRLREDVNASLLEKLEPDLQEVDVLGIEDEQGIVPDDVNPDEGPLPDHKAPPMALSWKMTFLQKGIEFKGIDLKAGVENKNPHDLGAANMQARHASQNLVEIYCRSYRISAR